MNLDAPQLAKISHAIASKGEVCQITLTDQEGSSFSFKLTFRQISHLMEPLRTVATEMKRRLISNNETAKAEMLNAIAEAQIANVTAVAKVDGSIDPVITFEGEQIGIVAVRLTAASASELAAQIGTTIQQRH